MSFTTDRTSGSSGVALGLLYSLERWLETDTSRSSPALRAALLPWLQASQAAQPTMALVHQLVARALEVADTAVAREASPADARQALLQSCKAERADLAADQNAVARTAASLVTEREPWIATLSSSGVVREAMRLVHAKGHAPHALIAESRPLLEGRELAAALGAAGVPTWIVVDAALPLLVAGARMAWIGADAVTDRGVVNKIGSFALALAARENSVPFYVLAQRRKFLPSGTPALKILEMPPEEVWPESPVDVSARNVYFELVPLELVTGIVVEDAVLGASEARTVALDRTLPEELRGA